MAARNAAAKRRGCSRWGTCPALVDEGERPAELGAHPLRVADRRDSVVAAADDGHGHPDPAQLLGVDRQRQGTIGEPASRLAGPFDEVVLDRRVPAPRSEYVFWSTSKSRCRATRSAEARLGLRPKRTSAARNDRLIRKDQAQPGLTRTTRTIWTRPGLGVAHGDAGARRETNEDRWRRAGDRNQPVQPLRRAGRPELSATQLGPSQTGQVGGDDPVPVDQSGDHLAKRLGEPTVSMQQDDRWAGAAVDQRRRDAGDLDPPGGDRDSLDQSSGQPVGRRRRLAGRPPIHGFPSTGHGRTLPTIAAASANVGWLKRRFGGAHARTCRSRRCQPVRVAVSVRYQSD